MSDSYDDLIEEKESSSPLSFFFYLFLCVPLGAFFLFFLQLNTVEETIRFSGYCKGVAAIGLVLSFFQFSSSVKRGVIGIIFSILSIGILFFLDALAAGAMTM